MIRTAFIRLGTAACFVVAIVVSPIWSVYSKVVVDSDAHYARAGTMSPLAVRRER